MIALLDTALMFIVVLSASFSVYYSFKARAFRRKYRQEAHPNRSKQKTKVQETAQMAGLYGAKTNIAMGTLLVTMAVIQFSFPDAHLVRLIVGLAFLALGLFNLVMGIRNLRLYVR